MSQAETDGHWMSRALDLARETSALASPNPQVGCVLTTPDGEFLAEGAHRYDKRDHAEIVALKQAASLGRGVRGATAFVTLEPCSHHGRTGPCADALIAAGVARCVVATPDPNPLVSGQGIAKLRAAGVEVALGLCKREARAINDGFAYFIRHRRPFVTLKSALSVDGMLAPAPALRSSASLRTDPAPFWVTGPAARAEVQTLRHNSDAILTGIGTVLADDPALTDRTGLPRRRPLLRVILDSALRTPPTSQLVRSAAQAPPSAPADLLLLCAEDAPTEREQALRAAAPGPGLEIERLPSAIPGRLDLLAVLDHLAQRAILSLLLETGSVLNGAFLNAGLVDKVILFFGPNEIGVSGIPFATGGPSPHLLQTALRETRQATFAEDASVTGYLRLPWTDA